MSQILPRRVNMQENQKNLAGIRGWLLFYVIYSIVGVLINPFYIFKMIEALEWNFKSVYDIVSYILIEVLLIISLFNLLALLNCVVDFSLK
jgi:hypothetical protein